MKNIAAITKGLIILLFAAVFGLVSYDVYRIKTVSPTPLSDYSQPLQVFQDGSKLYGKTMKVFHEDGSKIVHKFHSKTKPNVVNTDLLKNKIELISCNMDSFRYKLMDDNVQKDLKQDALLTGSYGEAANCPTTELYYYVSVVSTSVISNDLIVHVKETNMTDFFEHVKYHTTSEQMAKSDFLTLKEMYQNSFSKVARGLSKFFQSDRKVKEYILEEVNDIPGFSSSFNRLNHTREFVVDPLSCATLKTCSSCNLRSGCDWCTSSASCFNPAVDSSCESIIAATTSTNQCPTGTDRISLVEFPTGTFFFPEDSDYINLKWIPLYSATSMRISLYADDYLADTEIHYFYVDPRKGFHSMLVTEAMRNDYQLYFTYNWPDSSTTDTNRFRIPLITNSYIKIQSPTYGQNFNISSIISLKIKSNRILSFSSLSLKRVVPLAFDDEWAPFNAAGIEQFTSYSILNGDNYLNVPLNLFKDYATATSSPTVLYGNLLPFYFSISYNCIIGWCDEAESNLFFIPKDVVKSFNFDPATQKAATTSSSFSISKTSMSSNGISCSSTTKNQQDTDLCELSTKVTDFSINAQCTNCFMSASAKMSESFMDYGSGGLYKVGVRSTGYVKGNLDFNVSLDFSYTKETVKSVIKDLSLWSYSLTLGGTPYGISVSGDMDLHTIINFQANVQASMVGKIDVPNFDSLIQYGSEVPVGQNYVFTKNTNVPPQFQTTVAAQGNLNVQMGIIPRLKLLLTKMMNATLENEIYIQSNVRFQYPAFAPTTPNMNALIPRTANCDVAHYLEYDVMAGITPFKLLAYLSWGILINRERLLVNTTIGSLITQPVISGCLRPQTTVTPKQSYSLALSSSSSMTAVNKYLLLQDISKSLGVSSSRFVISSITSNTVNKLATSGLLKIAVPVTQVNIEILPSSISADSSSPSALSTSLTTKIASNSLTLSNSQLDSFATLQQQNYPNPCESFTSCGTCGSSASSCQWCSAENKCYLSTASTTCNRWQSSSCTTISGCRPGTTCTYSWSYGSWSSCSSSCTQSRTSSCLDSGGYQVSASLCTTSAIISQSCTGGSCPGSITYAWSSAAWSSCNSNCMQSRTVQCMGSDNNLYADSFCAGTKPTTSQSCTGGSCPSGGCSSLNSCSNCANFAGCTWGYCSLSSSVGSCMPSGSLSLSCTNTGSPTWVTNQATCPGTLSYSWSTPTSWSTCDSSCIHYRTTNCMGSDNNLYPDSFCGSLSKPLTSEYCSGDNCLPSSLTSIMSGKWYQIKTAGVGCNNYLSACDLSCASKYDLQITNGNMASIQPLTPSTSFCTCSTLYGTLTGPTIAGNYKGLNYLTEFNVDSTMGVILNPGTAQCYLTYDRSDATDQKITSAASIPIGLIAGAAVGVVSVGILSWVIYKYCVKKTVSKSVEGIQMNTL